MDPKDAAAERVNNYLYRKGNFKDLNESLIILQVIRLEWNGIKMFKIF